MRRKTRKAVVHLSIFVGLLCLIIFLTRPQSKKTFVWNEIRYKSTSTTLPEARGICPGLKEDSKPALIVARVSADGSTKWLDDLSSLYHVCIYTADAPVDKTSKYLQVPENRGHEAMAYLTFLIDNYDNIPAAGAVFIHGSRWAWHNDEPTYDNKALLTALNVSAALEPWGYHNMRCDWSLSKCPTEAAQGSFEVSVQAVLSPYDRRAVSDAALPGSLEALFGGDGQALLGRDDAVRSQCCAQFVVSRSSIGAMTHMS